MHISGVEVEVTESVNKKLARSRLTWVGRVDRMGDEKMAKRADAYIMWRGK